MEESLAQRRRAFIDHAMGQLRVRYTVRDRLPPLVTPPTPVWPLQTLRRETDEVLSLALLQRYFRCILTEGYGE